MEQEQEIKILHTFRIWDSDHGGLANFNGEKVYFICIHDWLDRNEHPIEVVPFIERHKIDIKQLSETEYWEKYKEDYIGRTENYYVYGPDPINYQDPDDYIVEETLYKFYRMPAEVLEKYEAWMSGSAIIKNLNEIIDINNFECLGTFRPSQLNKN